MPCRRKGSASWAVTVYLQCLSFQLFRAFPRSAGQGKGGILMEENEKAASSAVAMAVVVHA